MKCYAGQRMPHQQNVIRSGSHTQSSQTLRVTSPLLLSPSRRSPPGAKQSALRLCKSILRCSWKHLQLWRCIQDAPSRIVKFWSSWDLCTDVQETSREAETATQLCGILRARLAPLCSSAGDLMPYSHRIGSYITTRHFVLSYSSLLQSQDWLHHDMACII